LCTAPAIPITICLEANDVDGDNVSVCDVETLFNCSIKDVSDLCFIYIALPRQSGLDEVTITVCDDGSPVLTDQVVVNVNIGCGTPIANNDAITANEDGYGTVNPLNNDLANDACNPGITLTNIVADPSHGSAMIVNGQVQYQADAGYSGTDQITYEICNDCGNCTTAVITVEIPTGECENIYTACTSPVTPVEICVEFCAAPSASITEVDTKFECGIDINPPRCFTYIPVPGLMGTDTAEVSAVDANGNTDVAYVYVAVQGCGGVLVRNDEAETLQEESVTINVLTNDESEYNWEAITIAADAVYGSTRVNLDGTITYYPSQHYAGLDAFSYTSCDDKGQCGTAKVDIVVEEVLRTLPTLYDDLVSVYTSTTTTIDVLNNDLNPSDEALTIEAVTPALNGTVEMVDNELVYTANADFVGNDRVDYIACDNSGNCQTARVTISVLPEIVIETVQEVEEEIQEESVEEITEVEEEVEAEEELKIEGFEIIQAYEANNNLKISFTNLVDEQIFVRLIDVAGRLRYIGKVSSTAGINYFEINTSQIENGVFVIYLNNKQTSDYKKIFIE